MTAHIDMPKENPEEDRPAEVGLLVLCSVS